MAHVKGRNWITVEVCHCVENFPGFHVSPKLARSVWVFFIFNALEAKGKNARILVCIKSSGPEKLWVTTLVPNFNASTN